MKVGEDARDLALKLLVKDPTKRLGYKNDADELKKHKFFKGVNWDKMKLKMYQPPKILQFSSDEDTEMFSKDFTTQSLVDESSESVVEADEYFKGEKFLPVIRYFYFNISIRIRIRR